MAEQKPPTGDPLQIELMQLSDRRQKYVNQLEYLVLTDAQRSDIQEDLDRVEELIKERKEAVGE